jgi:hypothetical protein
MRLFLAHPALAKAIRSAAMHDFCRLGWTKNSIPKKANLFFHRSLAQLSENLARLCGRQRNMNTEKDNKK